MDDPKTQSAVQEAQAARKQGAQLEYDAQDEDALDSQSAAPLSRPDQPTLEKEQHP